MRKLICFAAVAALLVPLFSCGGGGSSRYRFDGYWTITERVSEDPFGISASAGAPVGTIFSNDFRIDQAPPEIVMRLLRLGWVYNGTCDTRRKTFTASRTDGPVVDTYSGQGEDRETMSGGTLMTSGPFYIRTVWTATLSGRAKAAGGGGSEIRAAIVEELKKR